MQTANIALVQMRCEKGACDRNLANIIEDEDFPGGGCLFGPGGERVFATPDWSEGAVYLSIDLSSEEVNELLAMQAHARRRSSTVE